MPDVTEFMNASRRAPGCGIAALWDDLDEVQAAKLDAALRAPVRQINHAAVVRVLESWGVDAPSRSVVGEHRRGGCTCG